MTTPPDKSGCPLDANTMDKVSAGTKMAVVVMLDRHYRKLGDDNGLFFLIKCKHNISHSQFCSIYYEWLRNRLD